jgi:peptidoglycan/xylan/chitin deacetylase (PgdA/CDA1 family)
VRRLVRLAVRLFGLPIAAILLRLLRLTGRRAGVAVIYHTVAERTGEPGDELVPPHGVELFAAQIRHLRRKYHIVPSADLQAAAAARRRGARFPAAITFDDDLSEHVRFALPVLERHGATATFFLTGTSLDAPYSFWWERLERAIDAGAPIPPRADGEAEVVARNAIRHVAFEVEWLAPVDRRRWSEAVLTAAGPDPADAGLRRAGVRRLVEAGMTIGFHTRRHDRMPPLDDESLAAAVRDGRDELEEVVGNRIDVIGYPHGGADGRVADASREAGFAVGYTTQEVAVTPGSDPLLLGRLNPSYRSPGHFALQLVRILAAAHR